MSPDNITRYNMAVLHIKGNNMTQANNVIQQLLADMGITVNSVSAKIPVPILNLLIYWNIRTENVEIALQLIKRRRVLILPSLNNNKALLKITK
jgi:CCR4-NOT transcription complex subunit 10